MRTVMKRVDSLLLKIKETERLDALQLSTAFIEYDPRSEKWQVIADLTDGVPFPKGRYQRLILECDTLEEAKKAAEDVEALHAPTGMKAKVVGEAVHIIDDIV